MGARHDKRCADDQKNYRVSDNKYESGGAV